MASGRGSGVRQTKGKERDEEGAMLRQLVQTLRGDLNMLSNEARKKYPAVRESAERGAMSLKTRSEAKGFSLKVLASTDDVVHPLLFACETKNPAIVKIGLSSLQKLIQYNAIPQKSVESIVATLNGLMNANVEELRIIQTMLLLVTSTDVVQGKSLTKVLVLCFKLYGSRDPSIHSMAGVAIRQIVSALFERVSKSTEEASGEGVELGAGQSMPSHTRDAYLLFQDICFLTNGDPPAWLPSSLDLELALGLELLEMVLRSFPIVFVKDKIFNQLLTERVCPLIVKLFSPTSKYKTPSSRLSPTTAALLATDKPTFSLSVRLLRILNVLIREFYASLITQCEIFLSMLVKFLDSDKPLWQRTLAVEVLHSFCNQPNLLRSFCESYDMQEHSSKIFGDIIDGLGGFIQSNLTSQMIHSSLMAITSSTPPTTVTNNSSSHMMSGGVAGGHLMHMFTIKNMTLYAEFLPANSHNKPAFLEMLEKTDIPLIPDGYPLVVAMNALMDAVKSVSQVINNKKKVVSVELKEVMLKSSWSGVMAALALLLDTCADERTTSMILDSHQTYIYLCGKLGMTSPRDAFITSLCKACLPPRYAMSLITQRRGPTKTQASASTGASQATVSSSSPAVSRTDRSHGRATNEGAPPPHIMPTSSSSSSSVTDTHSLRYLGARKKLNLSEIGLSGGGGVAGAAVEGVAVGGASHSRISGSGSSVSGGSLVGGVTLVKERDQQSALLTVKNLHCIETLLSIIDHHGNFLDTAWHLIMTTVQHVVEVFGLVPLSTGGFKQSGLAENSSLALVNVDKKKELSEVSENLTNLFKGSKSLSDSGISHLIKALSQLSTNSLQGSQSKEVGMFLIAALLEVGNINLSRVELIWSPITSHLSEACTIGSLALRSFAAEALTQLIRTSLENYSEEKVQLMLLRPLESMTRVPHSDVRQKQMDCITHILHSSGHSLGSSWSIILEVISSATRLQNENLVRAGFQSLQLVIADFLPSIPPSCVPSCVEVGGQYGLQTMDINISLTSIGILWNMADYLFQNRTTLQDNLELLKSQTSKSSQTSLHATFVKKIQGSALTVFDSLWMLLFKHLSDLCVDERSAVRKSACQTLFSTISAHGTLLQKETWQEVLWKVMFPLLSEVSEKAGSASTSSFQTAIMIHHSRDTAQKQWAETQVLTLTGTARLIQTRWFTLVSLNGFEKAWSSFLDILQTCAFSSSAEVSIAAMKSFYTIIDPQTPSPSPRSSIVHVGGRHSRSPSREITPPPSLNTDSSDHTLTPSSSATSLSLASKQSQMDKLPQEKREAIWTKAWNTWSTIGDMCVCKRLPSSDQIRTLLKSKKTEEIDQFFRVVPSQAFLVHLLQIFPHIFLQLRKTFSMAQFEVLSSILQASLLMPTSKDVSPFLVPSSNENKMTNAQRLILKCYSVVYTVENVVDPEKTDEGENHSSANSLLRTRKVENIEMRRKIELNSESCPEYVALYPKVLTELLKCASFASKPQEDSVQGQLGIPPMRSLMMSVNYTPFGLGALSLAVQFYVGCVQAGVTLPKDTAHSFLKTLHVPLKLKHSCPLPVVWMSSVEALLLVLETALPSLLKSKGGQELEFWRELAALLEDFLFNEVPEGVQLTAEQLREHEAMDIKMIELIKRDILPVSKHTPDEFLSRLTSILNRGSIHSATDHFDGPGGGGGVPLRRSAVPFRENFARVCFQALLHFSFINSQEATIASDSTSQLALNALLKRCEEVLLKYAEDERLSGNCPLPRSRMNEVSLVLKSVTVLISSLKEAQKTSTANIDPGIWRHVGQLFPALVQCVTCTSLDVRQALKEALGQFSDLMQPFPSPDQN